jgi:hypothetical protein
MADYPSIEDRLSAVEALLYLVLFSPAIETDETLKELRKEIFRYVPLRRRPSSQQDDTQASEFASFIQRSLPSYLARLSSLERMNYLSDQITSFQADEERKFGELWLRLKDVARNATEALLVVSESSSFAAVRFHRAVRNYIYASDSDYAPEFLWEAARGLSTALGFDVIYDGNWHLGSWLRDWISRAKDKLTSPEVQERLAKAEKALELQNIHKVQSGIDNDLSQAAMNLASALDKADNVIISIGALFAAKTVIDGKSNVLIRRLTEQEMQIVESNPNLLRDPLLFQSVFGGTQSGNVSLQMGRLSRKSPHKGKSQRKRIDPEADITT